VSATVFSVLQCIAMPSDPRKYAAVSALNDRKKSESFDTQKRRVRLAGVPKLRSGVIQRQTRAKAMLRVFSLVTNWRRRLISPPVEPPTGQQGPAEMIETVCELAEPIDSSLSATDNHGYGGSMIDRPDVIRAVAIVMLFINLVSLVGFWRLYNRKTDETLRGPLRFITDVNSAPASELSLLPGIGYELADRIVEDRETLGPYQSIDDLQRVRGIGPKTIAQIKSMVSLDPGAQEP